jgi:hypothetical protein
MWYTAVTMETITENVLYELWITFAERLLQRVVEVTKLSPEQEDALRKVMLRPNDFIIYVKDSIDE